MPNIKCLIIGRASTAVRLPDTKFLMFSSSHYTLTSLQFMAINWAKETDRHIYIFKSSPSKAESCNNSVQGEKQLEHYMTL